jgi:NAD(P)-dependent dehydrogenase (short-subunit alcohol dehydrogenase family)
MSDTGCPKGLFLSLDGDLALVTGGGQGIGAALAKGLAGAGAHVVVADRDADGARAVAAAIRSAGGQADSAVLDVSDADACRSLAAACRADHGTLSILVNNAGIMNNRSMTHPAVEDSWRQTWSVNTMGCFNMTSAFLDQLKARKGRVLNVSSVAAVSGRNMDVAYQATKAAISQITRGWAVEFAASGIRVNAIAPGFTETRINADKRADPDRLRRMLERIPLGRPGRAEEMVGAAVFLLSSHASFITGVVLPIDGGTLAT